MEHPKVALLSVVKQWLVGGSGERATDQSMRCLTLYVLVDKRLAKEVAGGREGAKSRRDEQAILSEGLEDDTKKRKVYHVMAKSKRRKTGNAKN